MASVTPFKISVPDSELERLHKKLELASFPDELEDSGWTVGAPLAEVQRLAKYWKDVFDWRKAEEKLNQLPQFTTELQADGFEPLNIHFVHEKSGVKGAIPLLFVHGWPGSFIEVVKIIRSLPKQEDGYPAFDVVAPSLPNYGFSEGVKKKGFGLESYAQICHKLMIKLGYDEYVAQGGDWGSFITRTMARLYPAHLKAYHINLVVASPPKWTRNPLLALKHAITPYTPENKAGLARSHWFETQSSGYNQVQSTKPQNIGYAFADSPVALFSWIYEKLHDWTDEYPWTDEEVCTWISIYWFSTAGPGASVRIYYENFNPVYGPKVRAELAGWIPDVKLGVAHLPKELVVTPDWWCHTLGPVVYESHNKSGGHFAAWERPDVIVEDLRKMFKKGGPVYGVVKGRDGYGSASARL